MNTFCVLFKSHLSFGESHSSVVDDASQSPGLTLHYPCSNIMKVYVSKLMNNIIISAPSDNVGDLSLFSSRENSQRKQAT